MGCQFYWHSAFFSGFPAQIVCPQRADDTKTAVEGAKSNAAMQHSAGLPAVPPVGDQISLVNVYLSMRDHGSTCQSRLGVIVTSTSLPKSNPNWPTFGPWVVRATRYPSRARAHRQGLHAWGRGPRENDESGRLDSFGWTYSRSRAGAPPKTSSQIRNEPLLSPPVPARNEIARGGRSRKEPCCNAGPHPNRQFGKFCSVARSRKGDEASEAASTVGPSVGFET